MHPTVRLGQDHKGGAHKGPSELDEAGTAQKRCGRPSCQAITHPRKSPPLCHPRISSIFRENFQLHLLLASTADSSLHSTLSRSRFRQSHSTKPYLKAPVLYDERLTFWAFQGGYSLCRHPHLLGWQSLCFVIFIGSQLCFSLPPRLRLRCISMFVFRKQWIFFFFSLAERVPIYEITSLTSVHLVKLLQPTRPYQRQKLKVFSFLNSILCSLYYSFFFTSDSNGVSKSVSSFMSPVLKCFSRPRLPAARQSHKKHH